MIEAIKNLGVHTGKFILIGFTIILGLFVLLAFLRFGFIYWIYSTVENWTVARLGFDYYLAELIATAFTSVFTLLLPTLLWFILLGRKQAWGIGTVVGIQLLICIAVYTLGSGVCFDRRTGKPLCYYTDTPRGRVWSYSPGFDPASGKPFRLYTREIKEAEDRQKNPAQSSNRHSRVLPVSTPSSATNILPMQTPE